MIPNFKDLTERAVLDGDKIKLDELLNKQIIVTGINLTKSKYADRGSGKCSKIQFYFPDSDGERHICFSGSAVIYEQLEEMQTKFEKEGSPILFSTTICKIGNYYSLT